MDFKKIFTKRNISWVLAIYVSVIFLQSLRFKFTDHPDTVHIFGTIGAWMGTNFLSVFSEFFINHGGIMIGIAELIASILLLIPMTRFFGALLSAGVLAGAIFFHLFTPLGINVLNDGGSLFAMAVLMFISSLIMMYMHKDQALELVKK